MPYFKRFSGILIATIALSSTAADAVEADISPRVDQGQIVTDAFLDGTGQRIQNARIFTWSFGEIIDNPFAIGDPGFNALSNLSGLPAGSRVGLHVLDDLRYWGGTEPVTFGTVPDQETLAFTFLGNTRTVGADTGVLPEMFFGPAVSATGAFHTHLNTLLMGSDGNINPAAIDGIEPTPGVYLVQARIVSNDAAVQDSAPVFALFNHGLDEADLALAEAFVLSTLVPEPTAGLVLGLGIGVAWIRSRSARRASRVG